MHALRIKKINKEGKKKQKSEDCSSYWRNLHDSMDVKIISMELAILPVEMLVDSLICLQQC